MLNKVVVLSVLLALNLCLVFSVFQYPKVRRDDSVSDDYFGTIVKDPYRWLEYPDTNETKAFVSDENAVTKDYVQQNKFREEISQNFRDLYNYPKYGVPFKRGSKYYFSFNTGLQNQNVYYSIDSIDSNDTKEFLDPNQLSTDGTTSLQFTSFSKDGKYCAYGISEGGSDWITIKIKDITSLKDLPETLNKIKFSSTAWTHDNLGFFYAQYDQYNGTGGGTDPEVPQNQKLFYHRINSNQSEDIKIVEFPDHPKWLIGTPRVSDDGKYVHIFPQEGTSSSPWFFAKLELPVQKALNFSAVTEEAEAEYYYVTSDDNLVYMRTNKNAARFRLVRIDLNNPDESNWRNILPEDEVSVLSDAVAVNKDYLAVIYMRDVVHIIQIHNLADGKYLWDVDTPIGTVSSVSAERTDTDFFYKITSFLHPGIIYRYDFSITPNTINTFKESKVTGLDTTLFETNQVFFRSKDGTVKVPMFLVHRRNIKLDGSNPTMLYAYGGFNINIQPAYDALGTFFIKNLNGIYAVANIRGGGEYGESWHESGMRTNKQNVFDDFASAAEYLIKNNYTRRDRLTINGRSNGGLLVGTSANQRPDLFGCALANVGVMDMLRFPLFTIGYAWREEYGDPQNNKTDFEYIYRYSPLHAIPKEATQYPAMLVLTADHDDRVVPAHSYKFAAELQYLLGTKLPNTPLMIRIDTNSGHGAGKPISKWIEEYTDIVSFVLNSLKIDYQTIKSKSYV